MKTKTKIIIIFAITLVSAFVVIFSVGYIQDIQRQEFFSKWREMRESWMDDKDSKIQSFQGENCSTFGDLKLSCFVNAYKNCSPAIIDQTITTIEGDPVYVIAQINSDCNVDLTYDSTMDRYSNQEIQNYVCYSVILQEQYVEFNKCKNNTSEESGFIIKR